MDYLAPDHPQQARILQIAAILMDEKFKTISKLKTYVVPPLKEFEISPKASERNGLTKEFIYKFGVPLPVAMLMFHGLMSQSQYQVGHNIKFDIDMFKHEEILLGSDKSFNMPWGKEVCTMKLATDICKLPGKYKNGSYKWPKLSEAYKHFFNEELIDAHDALADVEATARIFKHLKEKELIAI
jgi:DNA polymerase III epsilon subunit-like protein